MFGKVVWKEGKHRIVLRKKRKVFDDHVNKRKVVYYEEQYYPQKMWFIFWTNYQDQVALFPVLSYDIVFLKKEDAIKFLQRRS